MTEPSQDNSNRYESIGRNAEKKRKKKVRIRFKEKTRTRKKQQKGLFSIELSSLKNRKWIYAVLLLLLAATIWLAKDVITKEIEYERLKKEQSETFEE